MAVHQHVLVHPTVVGMDDDTLCDDECVRQRAIFPVDAVEFKARCAPAHITGATKRCAGAWVEACCHEGHTWIVDGIDEMIGKTEVAPLDREADADEFVAGAADAPP